jgi:hypothetical protein
MRLVYDLTANDTCFDPLSHLMGTAIPAIKIANHADPVEHWELVKALITNTRSATASANVLKSDPFSFFGQHGVQTASLVFNLDR